LNLLPIRKLSIVRGIEPNSTNKNFDCAITRFYSYKNKYQSKVGYVCISEIEGGSGSKVSGFTTLVPDVLE
jgi:hypothetical protein